MVKRLIQNVSEVRNWYERGETLGWMVDKYREKYNIQVSRSAFSSLATREGWERRYARDPGLIPWKVDPKHANQVELMALRAIARQRGGAKLSQFMQRRVDNLMAALREHNAVVHYDPEIGFVLVPREEQDGDDLVRQPPPELRSHRERAR